MRVLLRRVWWILGVSLWWCRGVAQPAEPGPLEQAYRFDAGTEEPRDAVRAARLYREAAAAGEATAHLRLGYLHETGDGVPQDYALARAHYEQAVALGLAEARMRLAICHLEGWGGPVDRAAFRREMTAAAEAGYAPAIRAMAGVCFIGVGMERDEAAGRAWLERLAAANDPAAQARIGRSIERDGRRNLIGEADRELARTWYQLSAEQDFAEAMRTMAASLLAERRDGPQGETARAWLELAAEGGDAESPFMLGVLAARPGPRTGAVADPVAARRWIELAAERSNGRADEVLQRLGEGHELEAALRYVLSTPYTERYLQRYGDRARREALAGDDGDRRPIPLRMVRPVFPHALRMSETAGQAMVAFTVDTTGRVKDVKCVEATHPLFGERAVAAVALWRFEPGRRQGRLVNTRMQVPVVFQYSPANSLEGLDGLLDGARSMAVAQGWVAEEPPQEFHLARPTLPLPRVVAPAGRAQPAEWRAVLLVHLDERGAAQVVHVLHAEPEWMGEAAAAMARAHVFLPVQADGRPTAAWVVLPLGQRRAAGAGTSAPSVP